MDISKAHIMVVDDIAENLQVLGNILHKEGFNISFAQDGKQAIEIIMEILPDLILLDVTMPEMDGFEVCTCLKKNEKTKYTPIIFLTAHTEIESMIKGFTLGAADYVTKPFNPQELLARVYAHIDIKLSKDIIASQNKKLKELNNAKDKFFSIIAHDLKNPFASLISSSELLLFLLEKNEIEKAKSKAQMIFDASKNGYILLQNLLEWSQSQLGNIKFSPENLIFSKLVNETILFVEIHANNKTIKINNEVPEDLELFADISLLEFILRNLITNAIKFTNSNGQITINAKHNSLETEICVNDNGVGIPKDIADKIFNIGSKITSKGTSGEKGTGLGLILCNEFVVKHGGKIWVESEVGKGSEFKFTLPFNKN